MLPAGRDAAAGGGSCRSESHEPAPVGRWKAYHFTAHRKRLERFSIGSEPNAVSVSLLGSNALALAPGLPGCGAACHATGHAVVSP
ncbi:MAG: hypothetical protein LBQ54_01365 [Planctomycetaceae bacterium]|jgi:hypothetical protein|nr:hypothetical protein [Planctomycetaceae bacterium]